jgi:chromate transporter
VLAIWRVVLNATNVEATPLPDAPAKPAYSLWQLVRYVLYLGTFGFGGPVALVGFMYRDLVEQRKWISETDYKEGLALSQLMPGPLPAQLAIYLGYVWKVKKLPEPVIVAVAAAAGLIIFPMLKT